MPECELEGCGISCQFGCSCMSSLAGCECWCENTTLPPLAWLEGMEKLDPDMVVTFTASEMPTARLAEFFDVLFLDQILIPASKARANYTTDGVVKQVKLKDLIEQIGLVTAQKPLVGRSMKDLQALRKSPTS